MKPKPPRGSNWRHDRRKALSQNRAPVHIFAAGHPTHGHQVAARKPFGIGIAVLVGKEEVAETVPKTLAITLTPVLKRLAASSLVTRACDDADERLMRIALTSFGRDLRTKLTDVPDCVEEATGLTKTEIRDLQWQLRRVRQQVVSRKW